MAYTYDHLVDCSKRNSDWPPICGNVQTTQYALNALLKNKSTQISKKHKKQRFIHCIVKTHMLVYKLISQIPPTPTRGRYWFKIQYGAAEVTGILYIVSA